LQSVGESHGAGVRRAALVLLDRDGVVVVNRATNIKRARDIALIPRAARAIARLNAQAWRVAICTNQPEVARGAMSRAELDAVHQALRDMLAREGAVVDAVYCCTSTARSPWRKPSPGMLKAALQRYRARAQDTPFVGDQVDDLKAAFHAGCPRFLVRTGLGSKVLEQGIPDYVRPVTVADDLWEAAEKILERGAALATPPEA
jgi:D-glycero-D-manno-heptose 1,7-bisphosphate phosphatase